MVEVVIIHDLTEVEKENSKELVWVKTQTFTITYLEDDGKTISAAAPTDQTQQSLEQEIPSNDVNANFEKNGYRTQHQKQEDKYLKSKKSTHDQSGVKILNRWHNQKTDELNRLTRLRRHCNTDNSQISSDYGVVRDEPNSSNDAVKLFTNMKKKKLLDTTCEYCLKDFPTVVQRRHHKKMHHYNKQIPDTAIIKQHSPAVQNKINVSNVTNNINSTNKSLPVERGKEEESKTIVIKDVSTVDGDFNAASTLDSESRSLRNTKPQCEICGKIFRTNYMLKRHEVIHTGEKPYPCDQCPRAFTQIAGLNRHKKEVHLLQQRIRALYRKFECELCNRIFKNLRYLTLHKQLAHLSEYSENGGGGGGNSNGCYSPSSSSLTSQEISHDYHDDDDGLRLNNSGITDEILTTDDVGGLNATDFIQQMFC